MLTRAPLRQAFNLGHKKAEFYNVLSRTTQHLKAMKSFHLGEHSRGFSLPVMKSNTLCVRQVLTNSSIG